MAWHKKRTGKLPSVGEWVPIGFFEHNSVKWLVSKREKREDEKSEWVNYHLMSTRPVTGKANFRLGWNSQEKRFAKCLESFTLKDKYNSLYSEFLEFAGLQPD